jgi:predicted phosphodiesterase
MKKYLLILYLAGLTAAFAQESARVKMAWIFDESHFNGKEFKPKTGTFPAAIQGESRLLNEGTTTFVELNGSDNAMQISDGLDHLDLPTKEVSVEALVRIRKNGKYEGIIGAFQDNGNSEYGWVLGLDDQRYFFALASENTKRMTYLSSSENNEAGKWYHVVGTYDGASLKLYLNGKLINQTADQSGPILYPEKAWLMIGAYRDDNEFFQMAGSLAYVKLYSGVLKEDEIQSHASEAAALINLPAITEIPTDIIVGPYLQQLGTNSVRILWETNGKSTAKILFGEKDPLDQEIKITNAKEFHEATLNGLKPNTCYFYKVVSQNDKAKKSISSLYSFQTAPVDQRPIAFGFVSDTQNNPKVWGKISELIFAERPDFVIHSGDIVGDGQKKQEWMDEFLKPGHHLMSRVNIYAILGNHENDATYYYQYISNPEPEYYYTFTYGNAQFFMLDTDRSVKKGSEQYEWLEKQLKESTKTWKFAVHHHPPYTSDEDDYGDTWKNTSRRGEVDLEDLPALYEKYDVDMVFFGHIHDYERTWPIRDNKVQDGGVVYVQGGGGGGGLENYAPTRSWFTAKVHRDHHFVYLTINNDFLQLQAIDWQGVLFDQATIQKER